MKKRLLAVVMFSLPLLAGTCGGEGSGGGGSSSFSTPAGAAGASCFGCEEGVNGEPAPAVPEPSSLLLATAGALLVGWTLRRRR